MERSLSSNPGSLSEIATLGEDVTEYEDSGLNQVTTYYYRVKAFNQHGDSPYSDIIQVTTPSPPPPAPTGLVATAPSPYLVVLTWNRVGNEVDNLLIERSISPNSDFNQLAVVPDTVVRYIDRTALPMMTYYYRLIAANQHGQSQPSAVASATTPQAPSTAPSNLEASAPNYYTVVLTWSDNSTDELGFTLQRYNQRTREWDLLAQPAADETNYIDNTVTQNTYYRYQIAAYNGGGDSPFSAEADLTTPDGPPGAL